MRSLITFAAITTFLTAPLGAAEWGATDSRSGGFAGARLRVPIGGGSMARPEASLAFAPTMMLRMSDGRLSTVVGEGITVNFAGRKPELNLFGMRADRALQFARGEAVDAERKSGLSTGAAIGIGVGVLAIGAAVLIATKTCVGEDPDHCGSD
jgi:hypothetical protein